MPLQRLPLPPFGLADSFVGGIPATWTVLPSGHVQPSEYHSLNVSLFDYAYLTVRLDKVIKDLASLKGEVGIYSDNSIGDSRFFNHASQNALTEPVQTPGRRSATPKSSRSATPPSLKRTAAGAISKRKNGRDAKADKKVRIPENSGFERRRSARHKSNRSPTRGRAARTLYANAADHETLSDSLTDALESASISARVDDVVMDHCETDNNSSTPKRRPGGSAQEVADIGGRRRDLKACAFQSAEMRGRLDQLETRRQNAPVVANAVVTAVATRRAAAQPKAAAYLTQGRTTPAMTRRPDQVDWPTEMWTYLLAGQRQQKVPILYRGRGAGSAINAYAIDIPRRYRHTPIEDQEPADVRYEESGKYGLALNDEEFDPDYRFLDLNLVRENAIAYAADAAYPPKGLLDLRDNGRLRFSDRMKGRNDGYDCPNCFGAHFALWCPVFPLAVDRRRLLIARRACLDCRGVHGREPCKDSGTFDCGNAACKTGGGHHHRELCSHTDLDRERQALHGRR